MRSKVVIIWLCIRGKWVRIDEGALFSPYGLEAALQPVKFTLKVVVLELSKKALNIGRVGDSDGVCIIDEDTRGGAPCRETGACGVRMKHGR
jgi:hypothetical protein